MPSRRRRSKVESEGQSFIDDVLDYLLGQSGDADEESTFFGSSTGDFSRGGSVDRSLQEYFDDESCCSRNDGQNRNNKFNVEAKSYQKYQEILGESSLRNAEKRSRGLKFVPVERFGSGNPNMIDLSTYDYSKWNMNNISRKSTEANEWKWEIDHYRISKKYSRQLEEYKIETNSKSKKKASRTYSGKCVKEKSSNHNKCNEKQTTLNKLMCGKPSRVSENDEELFYYNEYQYDKAYNAGRTKRPSRKNAILCQPKQYDFDFLLDEVERSMKKSQRTAEKAFERTQKSAQKAFEKSQKSIKKDYFRM